MSSASLPAPASEKSLVERLLSPIADVRPGEGPVVLLLSLNLFLVLLGYYLLKTIRESLVLTESGAAVKTYASAGQALLLLVLVPAFSAFASRVNRVRLLTGVTSFFIANLGLFYVAHRFWAGLGIPFFIWVGIFNTMGIVQYWGFANDLYTPEQGKRLFAIIMLAANLGAFVGGFVAKEAFKAMGPYNLMLVAAVILVACIGVARLVNRIQVRGATPEKVKEADEHLGKVGAFELLRKDRYLMLIAALVVLINVVNTTGEYLLGRMVVEASEAQFGTAASSLEARQAFVGAFYGEFYSLFNFLGFSLQILAVSRIMTVLGVGGALFIHPLVALGGYLSMAVMPSLSFVRNLKVARQLPRLLAQQHRQAGSVAPHEPRGQVQGEAGGRRVLLPGGGRRGRRGGMGGPAPGLRRARVRAHQRGRGPRVGGGGLGPPAREPGPSGWHDAVNDAGRDARRRSAATNQRGA